METSALEISKELSSELSSCLLYSGEHPAGEGWQIAFQFGVVKVSVAWTPTSRGVELFAWGAPTYIWHHDLSGEEVRELLIKLMNEYAKGEPMLNVQEGQSTKYQVVVDQYAAGSLAFINQLAKVAGVSHLGDGVYEVTGVSSEIDAVIAEHENAVLKVEAM